MRRRATTGNLRDGSIRRNLASRSRSSGVALVEGVPTTSANSLIRLRSESTNRWLGSRTSHRRTGISARPPWGNVRPTRSDTRSTGDALLLRPRRATECALEEVRQELLEGHDTLLPAIAVRARSGGDRRATLTEVLLHVVARVGGEVGELVVHIEAKLVLAEVG